MTKEILLLGEFSTGKSAFINMLLGVSLLPERLESTDLPVIKISGNGPAGLWLREQGQKYGRPLDRFKDIPSNWSEFEHAEITIPDHNLLNSGLVIWDTPGINSTHPQHNLHLDNFLKNSSRFRYIYFFLHSNITQSSIDFLKKNPGLWDKMIIIVNIKEIKPIEECRLIAKEVKKNVRLKVGNIPVELLYIGDICEEFNYLSASQRNGLSDYELLRQWKERQIDFKSLKAKFLDTIIGEEHIELIEELAEEQIQFSSDPKLAELEKALNNPDLDGLGLLNFFSEGDFLGVDGGVELLNKYAEMGHVPSQYLLSRLCYTGLTDILDEVQQFNMLIKAANQGCPYSQEMLGIFYRVGIGVQKDQFQAVKWFKNAADKGLHTSMVSLGESYFWGVGVDLDWDRAFTLFSEASKENDGFALFWLGHYFRLGYKEQDDKKAYQYYKMSADNQFYLGKYWLARCYFDACGVEKDDFKGFLELKGAIELMQSQPFAAVSYFYENLLNEKYGEIEELFARCHKYGRGTKIDNDEALKWYKIAADKGDSDALLWMGFFHETGDTLEQDDSEAFKYYQLSAEKGNRLGIWKLGKCYEQGVGTEPDSETAYKLFKESAEKDCSFAQYDLGECYEMGFGTATDQRKAIYWYRKAAAQGNENAQKKLDELE